MISRDKMFVVANNVDDSIKSITPIYDISIFPDFLKFEEYINTTPIVLNTIVISENELPFTSQNIQRLITLLNAPFLKLTGKCLYLVAKSTSIDTVRQFFDSNGIENIVVYQGDLSMRYISEIVSGAARESDESETELVTYRVRADEYVASQSIKMYESDDDKYETDEDLLQDIPPIDEPEPTVPTIDILTTVYYAVGDDCIERTLFAFIESQYLSLTGKTVIMERDSEFHTLTDMVTKSQVSYELIEVKDLFLDITGVLNKIKATTSKLIVLGCKDRMSYDYNFLFDLLISNLTGYVDYFVKECDFNDTPYGSRYNIICPDTVPEILKCINKLKYDVDNNVMFVGMRTRNLGELNVSTREMTDIVQLLLGKSGIHAEVVTAEGINLKGDKVIYDVLSLIGRGNERQG